MLPPDEGYLQAARGALVGLFRSRASQEAEILLLRNHPVKAAADVELV
jgi:hypothetical protein